MEKDRILNMNIKLSTKPGELGAYIISKAKEFQCSNSAIVRKSLQDVKEAEERRQLKNMPMFRN